MVPESEGPAMDSLGCHPTPARTPRPRRLLYVARVRPGHEVQVRYWQARFPTAAAAVAGIGAAEAFVGSGHYAVVYEIAEDDVQRALAAYLNDPAVRAFHKRLASFVVGLPAPGRHFGPTDDFHGVVPGEHEPELAPLAHYSSGDLPLAAGMYRWRAGEDPETGDEPCEAPGDEPPAGSRGARVDR